MSRKQMISFLQSVIKILQEIPDDAFDDFIDDFLPIRPVLPMMGYIDEQHSHKLLTPKKIKTLTKKAKHHVTKHAPDDAVLPTKKNKTHVTKHAPDDAVLPSKKNKTRATKHSPDDAVLPTKKAKARATKHSPDDAVLPTKKNKTRDNKHHAKKRKKIDHTIKPQSLETAQYQELIQRLCKMNSREEVEKFLANDPQFKLKKNLIVLAKAVPVHIASGDSYQDILSNIAEFTVGRRLEHEAIQRVV